MTALRALVWKRIDFRESSRLVTLVSSEGKLVTLAKGAHRPASPFLGRLDFLNLVDVSLSRRRTGLRLLTGVDLIHEPRGLREPRRYLASCYLVELTDRLWFEGRADPELFNLLLGGLTLLERCPQGSLAQVITGLELRLLAHLGTLPQLTECSQCGQPLVDGPLFQSPLQGGLLCSSHMTKGSRKVSAPVLRWLGELADKPGVQWPQHPPSPDRRSTWELTGSWIATSLEKTPRSRRSALAAT